MAREALIRAKILEILNEAPDMKFTETMIADLLLNLGYAVEDEELGQAIDYILSKGWVEFTKHPVRGFFQYFITADGVTAAEAD